MHRYLVVANQTLGGAALAAEIRRRLGEDGCSFHVVVPATRPKDQMVWTEGEAQGLARERLDRALDWFRRQGAEVAGSIGDERPLLAIEDALLAGRYDEVILSTLPAGMSRWMRQDLPARVRRRFGVPVTHVINEPDQARRPA